MRNAVSEVVGYLYIFGIVMIVLAIVFVQVNTMVEDVKRSILSQSLEKSFKRIQYLVHSVAFGDTPMQIVELELQGGEMRLIEEKPEFIIAMVNSSSCEPLPPNFSPGCLNLSTGEIKDVSNCTGNFDALACVLNKTTGILEYRYKEWYLSMESGSVFSRYSSQDYSKILYEPRILLNATAANNKYLVITVPLMSSPETFSISGSGRFRFSMIESGWEYTMIREVNIGENVSWNNFTDIYLIVRDSENKRAWCEFFESFPLLNVSLKPENCKGLINCNCYKAEEAMSRLDTGNFVTTIVVIFKNVTLKKI